MTHYAVKLAYLGWVFSGSQRQPEARTVEGDVISALSKIGAASDPDTCDLRSAGRTDKGVSALGNVISFHSDMEPEKLFPALAANLSDIFPWAYAEVGPDFNPRKARERWYRYWIVDKKHDIASMRRGAREFQGYRDFSRFSKADGDRSPMRRVNSVDVDKKGCFIVVDFRGESFLWNMVRRMTSALDMLGRGVCELQDISDAMEGVENIVFPPLPAESLVLMDVNHGIKMTQISEERGRELMERMMLDVETRKTVLGSLYDGIWCEERKHY